MKNRNKQTLQRRQVLFVTAMYFLVATMYIFYLPNLTSSADHHNSLFKREVKTALPNNSLERTDKATFKQTIKDQALNVPVAYLTFQVNKPETEDQRLNSFVLNSRSFPHHRFSYISLRVFKI
jgi:hypothetical protein